MLWWTAQNLIVASVLAAAVWLLCRLTRIGPTARHALWLIVLIKLLTPPVIAWPWPLPHLLGPLHPAESLAASSTFPPPSTPVFHKTNSPPDVPHIPSIPTAISHTTAAPPSVSARPNPLGVAPTLKAPGPQANPLAPAWLTLALTWLLGSPIYALVQTTRIRRLVSIARRGQPATPSLARRVSQMAHRMGMHPIPVRVVDALASPAIFSLAGPILLWPRNLMGTLPETSIDGLIVHELAHARRRDHWVGWLELLAGVAWWWNPLFWYVRHQLRENAELACDAWVVNTLPSERRAYAEALLCVCEFMSSRHAPAPAPLLGVGTGGRVFLERRLKMILRDRVPLRLSRLGLALIGLLATTTLPAWSQQSTPENKITRPESSTIHLDFATGPTDLIATFDRSPEALPQDAQDLIAQYDRQKADAQRELEQRLTRARADLTRQLKDLQDRYTKAGKLDEAVAIRDRLRAIEATMAGGGSPPATDSPSTFIPVPLRTVPDNLTLFRDRVGQTLTLHLVGSTQGTVWGTNVYTDDSSLAAAAVHAGILRPGQAGIVRVTLLPGRDRYDASTQHGVESHPYDAWPGSYQFSQAVSKPSLPDTTDTYTPVREDPGNLEALRDRVNQSFTFTVTGATDGPIWGGDDNTYTTDSNLATVAVHAGVLRPGQRGQVTVTILPDQGSYPSCNRNNIESHPWSAWHGSYRITPPTVPNTY